MIRFNQVSLMRGVKPLLENVDLTLNPGDKIGLIGANGAGKSSLFAMMRGELHPDQGEIDFPAKWRVAYVAQETPPPHPLGPNPEGKRKRCEHNQQPADPRGYARTAPLPGQARAP